MKLITSRQTLKRHFVMTWADVFGLVAGLLVIFGYLWLGGMFD